jgi:uncharacterized protein (DUF1697 family)
MNTYISLLRGINVGGHKKIKMAELKSVYESLQLKNVVTYIQSGNVVFQSELDENTLQTMIEEAIKQHFSFDVPVLILTKEQLIIVAKNLPFTTVNIAEEGSKIILFILSEAPIKVENDIFNTYLTNHEQLIIDGNIIYIYCPNGLGKGKLTNKCIETTLKVTSTARNIRTINKLLLLASTNYL